MVREQEHITGNDWNFCSGWVYTQKGSTTHNRSERWKFGIPILWLKVDLFLDLTILAVLEMDSIVGSTTVSVKVQFEAKF